VHGTGVYSVRVGPKGLALERFLDIKKKKKKDSFIEVKLFFLLIFHSVCIVCYQLGCVITAIIVQFLPIVGSSFTEDYIYVST
jgi:hypothetical protein